ncbi:MAG: hypothetical protein ACTSR8_14080 [Promethearchaeota archaeon]
MKDIYEFTKVKDLFLDSNVLNISGESGTGKTTLALQLVGNILKDTEDTCIWIQASDLFPKKRAEAMFLHHSHILDSFYILPSRGICKTYAELASTLSVFNKPDTLLPPAVRFIIVDNISHHLRYEITRGMEYRLAINSFFNQIIFPMVIYCKNHHIVLILIHEVSYNPKLDKTVKFLSQLYERIESSDIILSKKLGSSYKFLVCSTAIMEYELGNAGLLISKCDFL